MDVLPTAIRAEDATYQDNLAWMTEQVALLKRRAAEVQAGGGAAAVEKHTRRGKLFVRDRIQALLDEDSPFLEIGMLAAYGLYDGVAPCAGIVTGIGRVQGTECMIVANDATVKGGTYFPLTVKKHLRAQEIAWENGLPCLYLVDSGGAFLPMQDLCLPGQGSLRAHLL